MAGYSNLRYHPHYAIDRGGFSSPAPGAPGASRRSAVGTTTPRNATTSSRNDHRGQSKLLPRRARRRNWRAGGPGFVNDSSIGRFGHQIIDYVVGMNPPMGATAAIVFAARFYRALGFGPSVKGSGGDDEQPGRDDHARVRSQSASAPLARA
jgi:hypothetical protein